MNALSGLDRKTSWNSYIGTVFSAATDVSWLDLESLWRFVKKTYEENKTLYVAGNGGCFSIAAHLAVDWGKGSICDGPNIATHNRRMKVVQLGANGSKISAWANDVRYDEIYKQELITLTDADRFSLLVLSCSGNSPNILSASEYAKTRGAGVFGLVSFDGGRLMDMIDCLWVKSKDYRVSEDVFHQIFHYLVDSLKSLIVGS